jgi:DNA-binding FrmR family transcriptional regulator
MFRLVTHTIWKRTKKENMEKEEEKLKVLISKDIPINYNLFMPAEYYHDPKWERYKLKLKRMREAYRKNRKQWEEKMNKETIHWKDLGRIKRVIGQLKGITKMIEEGSSECREIAYQLKSASTVLRKCALYILRRHYDQCLNKGQLEGSKTAQIEEIQLKIVGKRIVGPHLRPYTLEESHGLRSVLRAYAD